MSFSQDFGGKNSVWSRKQLLRNSNAFLKNRKKPNNCLVLTEMNTLDLLLEMGISPRCTVFSVAACTSEGVWYHRQPLVSLRACPVLHTATGVAQGSFDAVKPHQSPCLNLGNRESRILLLKLWCSWWFVNAMGYECEGKESCFPAVTKQIRGSSGWTVPFSAKLPAAPAANTCFPA